LKARFPSFLGFYTDGSKDSDRVAAAAVCQQHEFSTRLPSPASIYTAELKAILMALEVIEQSNKTQFLICSDSLSCLQAIQNVKLDHPFLRQIQIKLSELNADLFDIIFCWVPAHVGLKGNERADRLAKQALLSPVELCPIPHTDFRPSIHQYCRTLWQTYWSDQSLNKLFSIQPTLGFWPPYRTLSRKDQALLTRCRIGHTRATHGFLLAAEPRPQCVFCSCPLAVQHLLLDCVDLILLHQHYFTVAILQELFTSVSPHIIVQFLKASGLC
jgi:ribonuclease HI